MVAAPPSKSKVHVLYEHDVCGNPHGSAYIRLLEPLDHPLLKQDFCLSAGARLPESSVDIAVVDRLWQGWGDAPAVEQLLAWSKTHSVRLIHALDDDLYALDAEPATRDYPAHLIRRLSRQADHVVVTTSPLHARASHYNRAVTVIPNALNPALFEVAEPRAPSVGEKICVGYMGTFTHADDLRMILAPLRAFLQAHADAVEFQLVGIGQTAECLGLFDGYPVRVIEPPHGLHYPAFLQWFQKTIRWDIAIAPLRPTPFNACKSDLKYLDYTLLGIPGIYSANPVYTASVRHGETGLLAQDEPQAWLSALNALYASPNLRAHIVRTAQAEVRATRLAAQAAAQWARVFAGLMETAPHVSPDV